MRTSEVSSFGTGALNGVTATATANTTAKKTYIALGGTGSTPDTGRTTSTAATTASEDRNKVVYSPSYAASRRSGDGRGRDSHRHPPSSPKEGAEASAGGVGSGRVDNIHDTFEHTNDEVGKRVSAKGRSGFPRNSNGEIMFLGADESGTPDDGDKSQNGSRRHRVDPADNRHAELGAKRVVNGEGSAALAPAKELVNPGKRRGVCLLYTSPSPRD